MWPRQRGSTASERAALFALSVGRADSSHTPDGAMPLALPLGEQTAQSTERAEKASLYWTRLRNATHGSPVQGELATEQTEGLFCRSGWIQRV